MTTIRSVTPKLRAYPMTSKQASGARSDLRRSLNTILQRDGESQLMRLLIDLLESNQLELISIDVDGGQAPIWKAAGRAGSAESFFGVEDPEDFENVTDSVIAGFFLSGKLTFSSNAKATKVLWRVNHSLGLVN